MASELLEVMPLTLAGRAAFVSRLGGRVAPCPPLRRRTPPPGRASRQESGQTRVQG